MNVGTAVFRFLSTCVSQEGSYLGRIERHYFPFFRTSQEKFLMRCYSDQKLGIISGPRGCRKSQSAARLAARGSLFYRYVHIKQETVQNTRELEDFKPKFGQQMWEFVWSPLLGVLIALLTTVYHTEVPKEGGEGRVTQYLTALKDGVPTFENMAVVLLTSAVGFMRSRRTVRYILDDVTIRQEVRGDSVISMRNARHNMEKLRIFCEVNPGILISSNEGTRMCFDDSASLKFKTFTAPLATPTEFMSAANRCAIVDGQDTGPGIKSLLAYQSSKEISDDDIIGSLQRVFPDRWVRSMRFWGTWNGEELVNLMSRKEEKLSLHSVLSLSVNLELEAGEVFRVQALVYSPPCSDEDRKKIAKLTLGADYREDVLDEVIPKDCPFRLALANAVLYRLEKGGDDTSFKGVRNLLKDFQEQLLLPKGADGRTEDLHIVDVDPLLERATKLFKEKFPENHQTI